MTRISEAERREYEALSPVGQTAYKNLRETNLSHREAMRWARDPEAAERVAKPDDEIVAGLGLGRFARSRR